MNDFILTDVKQVKVNNIKKILLSLFKHEKSTKMELAIDTKLSNSTLSDSINSLRKLNIVEDVGLDKSIGGRPPTVFELNRQYGYFLGISAGKESLQTVVTDFHGNFVKSTSVPYAGNPPFISLLYGQIEQILEEFPKESLLAIGFNANGTIDYERGIILNSADINWHNVHIEELVERKFTIPLFADHSINNALTYEMLLGHATTDESFMLLCPELCDKVGICLNGNILRGDNNLAGRMAKPIDGGQLLDLKRFLSLETAFVLGAQEDWPDGVRRLPLTDEYFAIAAAVHAEIQFFSSVYFVMRTNNI